MKHLLLGVAIATITTSVALAQPTRDPAAPLTEGPGRYLVFFPLSKATLSADDQQVISQAADEFRRTGSAQIHVSGHTDTTGSAAYNLRLSERRAQMVAAELERLGIPATDLVVVGRGQEDLRIPTADHVMEAGNRRVEIAFDVPAPVPEPAPVAETPPPAPAKEQPPFLGLRMAALYGHNFGEKDEDNSSSKTQNDLAGLEFTFDALPGDFLSVALKQDVLYSFNGEDDGVNGRSGLSIGIAPLHLWIINPYLSANAGYIYGPGVQNGFVAGPELGFNIPVTRSTVLNVKAAYDYQFRNSDWDKGIVWGGLGLGFLF